MTDISREGFLEALHDALNHLYNADQLRKSSLADVFNVANRFDTSSAMRKILSDAIDSLKPPASEPDSSKAWRTYESLYCCFIQQLNQQVVADQLCISPRQLRREQHYALEHLADVLWQRYQLSGGHSPAAAPAEENSSTSPIIGELSWLMEGQPVKAERLADEVQSALDVVQPLAAKTGVSTRSLVSADLPGLAVHSVALNQILVSLLGLAIQSAESGGTVQVAARKLPAAVEIILQVSAQRAPQETSADNNASLEIAAELARISGGRLYTANTPGQPFPIRLILPVLEQFPVLVVDDTEDSLQLMKRYAAGTRYNLTCTRDTAQVSGLIESLHPNIIVLDIMMPKENGWMVLGRLRQHPLTRETPIIICTILPQERLALSLGASAFLKKPVSRQDFLRALDQQFALLAPEYP